MLLCIYHRTAFESVKPFAIHFTNIKIRKAVKSPKASPGADAAQPSLRRACRTACRSASICREHTDPTYAHEIRFFPAASILEGVATQLLMSVSPFGSCKGLSMLVFNNHVWKWNCLDRLIFNRISCAIRFLRRYNLVLIPDIMTCRSCRAVSSLHAAIHC